MGTLYLVATPIGNLEDISFRALKVLKQVVLVAAEDTRQTRKLLSHFEITTPLTSYFEHNKLNKLDAVLEALKQGDVALVSDAGTPAINDPGYELVRACLAAGHAVSPIPGPSAPVAALVASGLPTDKFLYLGYLPRKAGERRYFLSQVADLPYTLIFLEAPHRVLDSLQDLLAVFGDRPCALGRELTKLHEEIFRGLLSQAYAHFLAVQPRGEFTLVVAGKEPQVETWDERRLRAALKDATGQSKPLAQVASQLAALSGWPRREIYRMAAETDQEE